MNKTIHNSESIRDFLEAKVLEYNTPDFIDKDPISIPHKFSLKEDIEIIGFLISTIAWGNRKSILNSGNKLINIMGSSPYDFIMSYEEENNDKLDDFKHRTFNSFDLNFFFVNLKNIYSNFSGLETVFTEGFHKNNNAIDAIINFRNIFLGEYKDIRTKKHVANPENGSASKRINMFLRWMVRNDNSGVDFGLWKNISPAWLSCPLDVHSANSARKLGLLTRKQNDLKSVVELDTRLREFDCKDPVKYDFALFGMGVNDPLINLVILQ
jgi:uncharacterized protein (TIGR02757 family)